VREVSSLSQPARRQRRDAERNRASIVEAFAELLASDGADVPMYRVARRAGVGQATLYRHFPERALLAAAIYEHRLDHVAELAAAQAGDPRAFLHLIQALIQEDAHTPGLLRMLRESAQSERFLRRLTTRAMELLAEPLRTAQAAGIVRGDLQLEDVHIFFAMMEGAGQEADRAGRPQVALRAFELLARGVAEPGKWPAAPHLATAAPQSRLW
jgi:AcrR family transcriptional regulator